jgi:hypothetical protein
MEFIIRMKLVAMVIIKPMPKRTIPLMGEIFLNTISAIPIPKTRTQK